MWRSPRPIPALLRGQLSTDCADCHQGGRGWLERTQDAIEQHLPRPRALSTVRSARLISPATRYSGGLVTYIDIVTAQSLVLDQPASGSTDSWTAAAGRGVPGEGIWEVAGKGLDASTPSATAAPAAPVASHHRQRLLGRHSARSAARQHDAAQARRQSGHDFR